MRHYLSFAQAEYADKKVDTAGKFFGKMDQSAPWERLMAVVGLHSRNMCARIELERRLRHRCGMAQGPPLAEAARDDRGSPR